MTRTLLALDLSTAHGSIAVVRGTDVLFQSSFQSERSHNAQVFAPLRGALAAAGSDLTGIVIGNGPGSYTGVRIAIAAAQGVALSRNVWCVGWSSLTAPDIEVPDSYPISGDAHRNPLPAVGRPIPAHGRHQRLLHRVGPAPRGEQSCSCKEIQVGHEQARLPIRLKALRKADHERALSTRLGNR